MTKGCCKHTHRLLQLRVAPKEYGVIEYKGVAGQLADQLRQRAYTCVLWNMSIQGCTQVSEKLQGFGRSFAAARPHLRVAE